MNKSEIEAQIAHNNIRLRWSFFQREAEKPWKQRRKIGWTVSLIDLVYAVFVALQPIGLSKVPKSEVTVVQLLTTLIGGLLLVGVIVLDYSIPSVRHFKQVMGMDREILTSWFYWFNVFMVSATVIGLLGISLSFLPVSGWVALTEGRTLYAVNLVLVGLIDAMAHPWTALELRWPADDDLKWGWWQKFYPNLLSILVSWVIFGLTWPISWIAALLLSIALTGTTVILTNPFHNATFHWIMMVIIVMFAFVFN